MCTCAYACTHVYPLKKLDGLKAEREREKEGGEERERERERER